MEITAPLYQIPRLKSHLLNLPYCRKVEVYGHILPKEYRLNILLPKAFQVFVQKMRDLTL